jgi:micrococcal nuclease
LGAQAETVVLDATPSSATTAVYPVTKVRDGDTIEITYEGKTEAVRLVGINTPETVDPRRPIQCFGKEASNRLKSQLTGKSVSLETDSTQSDRDKYGRLLRFVFIEGQDVGLIMLREGFAQESLYSSVPHKYRDLYLTAQTEAKNAGRGLWSPEACSVVSPTTN